MYGKDSNYINDKTNGVGEGRVANKLFVVVDSNWLYFTDACY